MTAGVTGLFLFDGGKVYDEAEIPSLNRATWYRTQLLPSFGLVLQGLESRLNDADYTYYANCVRSQASGYVFQNREADYISRGVLNQVSGDDTPVLILNWVSGDFSNVDDYRIQFRAVEDADNARVEFFPIIDITVIQEV